jgi:hypothetical protein
MSAPFVLPVADSVSAGANSLQVVGSVLFESKTKIGAAGRGARVHLTTRADWASGDIALVELVSDAAESSYAISAQAAPCDLPSVDASFGAAASGGWQIALGDAARTTFDLDMTQGVAVVTLHRTTFEVLDTSYFDTRAASSSPPHVPTQTLFAVDFHSADPPADRCGMRPEGGSHAKGCPSAREGSNPSINYCAGLNSAGSSRVYPWWSDCCVWASGSCTAKTTGSLAANLDEVWPLRAGSGAQWIRFVPAAASSASSTTIVRIDIRFMDTRFFHWNADEGVATVRVQVQYRGGGSAPKIPRSTVGENTGWVAATTPRLVHTGQSITDIDVTTIVMENFGQGCRVASRVHRRVP